MKKSNQTKNIYLIVELTAMRYDQTQEFNISLAAHFQKGGGSKHKKNKKTFSEHKRRYNNDNQKIQSKPALHVGPLGDYRLNLYRNKRLKSLDSFHFLCWSRPPFLSAQLEG